MRLDAFIARTGFASRSEARRAVRRGRVRVSGEVCRDPAQVVADDAVIDLDEARLESPARPLHVVLHKPLGFSCSADAREAPLVLELLPDEWVARKIRMVGRLDRETSGLLVLTTEGDLVHALTHPRKKRPKRYRLAYRGELAPDAVARCADGLDLGRDEPPTHPATLTLDGPGRATLTLTEGRTYQVRRMIRALGGEVETLHRDRVGAYDLPADLAEGEWLRLTEDEVALLQS